MNSESVKDGRRARLTVYLAIATIAIGLTLIAIGTKARGQNNDNGSVMPKAVGGAVLYVVDGEGYLVWHDKVVATVPAVSLDGTDGVGGLPAHVGTTSCWVPEGNDVEFQQIGESGDGDTLGQAVANFHANHETITESFAQSGWHQIDCP